VMEEAAACVKTDIHARVSHGLICVRCDMDPELGHCRLGGFVAVLILVRFAGLIRFVG